MDITGGVGIGGGGHTYDPPWRSISEGRGLPRTRVIRGLLPFILLSSLAVLVITFVAAEISLLVG
jgi:hypothetical protein